MFELVAAIVFGGFAALLVGCFIIVLIAAAKGR